jgi:hypothetical protein
MKMRSFLKKKKLIRNFNLIKKSSCFLILINFLYCLFICQFISNGMACIHRIYTEKERRAAARAGRPGRKCMVFLLIFSYILNTIPPLGNVKSIAPGILEMRFLTPLLLGNNQLQRIPAEIAQLSNMTVLGLSHNKLRSLPADIGDLVCTHFSAKEKNSPQTPHRI